PVTVNDDKIASVTCPSTNTVGNNDLFLDPGETVTCTGNYAITAADLASLSVTNHATASAGGTPSNQDSNTINGTPPVIAPAPGVSIQSLPPVSAAPKPATASGGGGSAPSSEVASARSSPQTTTTQSFVSEVLPS